jgi:hypothetical protein
MLRATRDGRLHTVPRGVLSASFRYILRSIGLNSHAATGNGAYDPCQIDIREEIQPVPLNDDFYAAYLVLLGRGIAEVENARQRHADDEDIMGLVKEAQQAFLELQNKHGVRVKAHSVFGPMYRRLVGHELPQERYV